MTRWDPAQYLRIADERGRPFANLGWGVVGQYKAALRLACSRRSYGTVLPFSRVFCVAVRA